MGKKHEESRRASDPPTAEGAAEDGVAHESRGPTREPLSSDRWRRVAGIVEVALELDRATRAVYLETLGSQDEDLRRRVLSILRSMHAVDTDTPAGDGPQLEDFSQDDRLGPWKILRLLGSGGMGVVFLAERDDAEYERRVAIKVIGGGFQAPSVYRRFLAERQILAAFDHPNIARLFDGGTARDGRPYLVMEYVDGEPVDDYCFAKDLSFDERLVLFRKICSAVAYAHRQLVVHRDLKPTNILVGGDGEPKLLDFGIAKLLEPGSSLPVDAEPTRTTQAVMTPTWASPEQLQGAAISTATDVYSLGLILYRLLTGDLPPRPPTAFGEDSGRVTTRPSRSLQSSLDEADEHIWSIARRRQAARLLRGDLDNIVMKALRPEPEKRYPSVEAFDEDIERFLDGRPVTATRDTPLYLLRKTVSRYRWQVVAAIIFVASVLAVAGVALFQADKVRSERDRAEDQARRAEQQAERAEGSLRFLGGLLRAADETERKKQDLSVRDLLMEGMGRLEAGAVDAPEAKVDLLQLIAESFFDFRDLPSTIEALELAHEAAVAGALPTPRQTELLAELAMIQIIANDQANIRGTCEALLAAEETEASEVARSRCVYALEYMAWYRGDLRELGRLKRAHLEELATKDAVDPLLLMNLGRWADLMRAGALTPEATSVFLTRVARLAGHQLPRQQAEKVWLDMTSYLVDARVRSGEPELAKRLLAWEQRHRPTSHDHDTVEANYLLIVSRVSRDLGEFDETLELIAKAEEIGLQMQNLDASDLRARFIYAEAPRQRAMLHRRLGQEQEVRENIAVALERFRDLTPEHGENFFVKRSFARLLMHADLVEEARPLVEDLLGKGYRERRFLALADSRGLLPQPLPLPPGIEIDLTIPAALERRFEAARHVELPWERVEAIEEAASDAGTTEK